MSPRLSIIIPVYREPVEICRCLAYLAGCPDIELAQLIVVDGDDGSSRTPDTILPVETIIVPPGRGGQLNAGAARARSDVLLFLHVDTRPPRSFVRRVVHSVRSRPAGAFDLHIESGSPVVRMISVSGMIRSRLTRIPYGDQVQFITRGLFERIGGFPHEPLMEDVALMDRIREAGASIRILRPPAVTSGRRWRTEGAVRTTLRNWRIMLAYRSGISPAALRGRYRPQAEIDCPDTLAVFFRALRPGRVKTRLAQEAGDAAALALYEAMLRDLKKAVRIRAVRMVPFIDEPLGGRSVFADPVPQIGENLWERMTDAMERSFAGGSSRVVLVGSDIPGLSRGLLRLAFTSLSTADIVLGPSTDAGFYLLGARHTIPVSDLLAFAAAAPETSGARIVEWARKRGIRIHLLPALTDVDTVGELREVLADSTVDSPQLRLTAASLGL